MNFKKDFWEKKIIGWENGRYAFEKTNLSTLENVSDKLSSSLIFRQKFAIELLKPVIKGAKVVELGCGSGLLTQTVFDLGCAHYTGYDISENAIKRAKDLVSNRSIAKNVEYFASDVSEIKNNNPDIVFSLGLLDWLNNDEIKKIFLKFDNSKHLHSISENRKFNIYIFMHKIYVYLSYGFKSNGYKPTYHSKTDIEKLYYNKKYNTIGAFRDKKLKFGAFIKNY